MSERRRSEDWLEDMTERWHAGEGHGKPLHEFLGMTWDEYTSWAPLGAQNDAVRAAIIRAMASADPHE